MNEEYMSFLGECIFCGQERMVEIPESIPEEEREGKADEAAAEACNCEQGRRWREKRQIFDLCDEQIEGMFREKCPEVADFLKDAKELVFEGRFAKKINIYLPNGEGVARIINSKGDIKIEHEKTLKTEASTAL